MGRTRHGLDPAIGLAYGNDDVSKLQRAEGLVGVASRTGIGGFADLRNVVTARQAHTAFDEFFHTADFRQGQGYFGRYAISHLGVFIWRLMSLAVGPVTPVPVTNCPGWYSFDPTGRNIPLFSPGRAAGAFGDQWKTPGEGQVAAPISQALLDSDIALGDKGLQLYPKALSVVQILLSAPSRQDTIAANDLTLRPERGQFFYQAPAPVEDSELVCFYRYGFPSEIGAGPYDRRSGTLHVPVAGTDVGMPSAAPLTLPASGAVTLNHSLTWPGANDVDVSGELVIQAGNHQRPVLRFGPGDIWTLTGAEGSSLVLDGLLISGADIVLAGSFDRVVISCCTLDPGSAAPSLKVPDDSDVSSPPVAILATTVDHRELAPTRLWIEATVGTISVDRSVTGPIRTRNDGLVEQLSISNGIVQGIRTGDFGSFEPQAVKDPARLGKRLQAFNPVSRLLQSYAPELAMAPGGDASPHGAASPPSESTLPQTLGLLDALISGPQLWDAEAFARVPLSASTRMRLAGSHSLSPAPVLNRLLLEDAFPFELADAAIALTDGEVRLSRCTVLGRIIAHRFDASECILQQLAEVNDIQHGCVRFSAWADGSLLPRKYECVRIPQNAPLFTSTDFAQPGYAQLLPLADAQILPGPVDERQNTISAGAEDGSEMGAYARDKNPIKQRALLLKFLEYMPAGLSPVIIPVT
ncbi:hypothetical protein [Bradyrhizobium niftali]|uniref:hypothetical protein n=1 Tax=Bradyrhizobium niftali TaxID=2560055 RepID=UPI00384E82AE